MEMSVSQALGKKGEKKIYVLFTEGAKNAEGAYPECKIVKNSGFSVEEAKALESYMKENAKKIEEMAKTISLWKAFGGKKPGR